MKALTPRQIVAELDRYIVGQEAAKRAVAIAIRNRWRRQQLPPELRKDVTPKNIIMIGPTGVGKTEIARRLAELVGAPFLKVEATKYTEVGYVGRDVESMIRDLTEIAVGMVKQRKRQQVESEAASKVTERLLDLLFPQASVWDPEDAEENDRRKRTRDKMRARLEAGEFEERKVELQVEQKSSPIQILGAAGVSMEQMESELQSMFDRILPKGQQRREVTVREARRILLEQEADALIDKQSLREEAVELVENHGIIFIDEIDKVAGSGGGH
ncbi:MAG: AAA family ATPase, partial [Nitrospira sp.]|nr:AAA family ATPase [Nitrospira sp.]